MYFLKSMCGLCSNEKYLLLIWEQEVVASSFCQHAHPAGN